MKSQTTIYPSGAKVTIIEGHGFRMTHWELPEHDGDIFSLLRIRYPTPWASPRDVTDWTPDPTAGSIEL